MVIYSGSRYAKAKITAVEYEGGVVKQFIHSRRIYNEDSIGNESLIVELNVDEELDLLAHRSWNEAEKWWFIADVNSIIFPLFDSSTVGPNQIHVGSSVIIPDARTMRRLTS